MLMDPAGLGVPISRKESILGQLEFADRLGILPYFTEAANRYGLDEELLMGIASRETHMGRLLKNSLGDRGFGFGIMQIDKRFYPEFTSRVRPNDHRANIMKGAEIFAEELRRFDGNVQAALAAYNAGPGNVQAAIDRGLDPDTPTTGGDYGKDVLDRVKAIRELTGTPVRVAGFNLDLDSKKSLWMLGFSVVGIIIVSIGLYRETIENE